MAITVILAVGWDSWLLAAQSSAWRAAGYIAVSTPSVAEALQHFKAGDFDLVLLGNSVTPDEGKRLTLKIRETGAKAPVIATNDLPSDLASIKNAIAEIAANPLLSFPKWPQGQPVTRRLAERVKGTVSAA